MDQRDIDLLEKHIPQDAELKALWEDHLLFEKKIEKLEHKNYLTPQEQQELKLLKKQKLDGKTRLMDILDKLKKEDAGRQ